MSVVDGSDGETYLAALLEFEELWQKTLPLTQELIDDYKTRLYYSIERWDMDYNVANSDIKPNYMQRRALKELNRVRALGATKALVVASAGSGKTFLAAFDALNFGPKRLLYIVHEGSILMKSYETFTRVFGSDRSYGVFNADYKEYDKDFVFSTNVIWIICWNTASASTTWITAISGRTKCSICGPNTAKSRCRPCC